jgi:molybdenum cofactor cytidylyltransferase
VRIGGVVLAAGAGRRFGDGVKQLAEVGGRPLLAFAVDAIAAREPRVVVLGHAADEIRAAVDLSGVEVVVCEGWAEGQAASLRCGIASLGPVDAAVIVLGDQPGVGREAVEEVVRAARPGDEAVRATYHGEPGHPVLVGRGVLGRARHLRGDAGFRDVLADVAVRTVELADLADPADIDTPEALATARIRESDGL